MVLRYHIILYWNNHAFKKLMSAFSQAAFKIFIFFFVSCRVSIMYLMYLCVDFNFSILSGFVSLLIVRLGVSHQFCIILRYLFKLSSFIVSLFSFRKPIEHMLKVLVVFSITLPYLLCLPFGFPLLLWIVSSDLYLSLLIFFVVVSNIL